MATVEHAVKETWSRRGKSGPAEHQGPRLLEPAPTR